MSFLNHILNSFVLGMKEIFLVDILAKDVIISPTKKEFSGDYTLVLFPFTKATKDSPENIGNKMGNYLMEKEKSIQSFNVIKGFLNLEMSDAFWKEMTLELNDNSSYGISEPNGKSVLVEFSSPNTNKPLHLGHIRNILLGWSVSRIFEANGYKVIKAQIVNDRGIAICKSMLSWLKFGNGETPALAQKKSDHFVGDYYVLFENKFQEEYRSWQLSESAIKLLSEKNISEDKKEDFFKEYKNIYFNQFSILGKEAREMLQQWENGDADVISLWKKMNSWVYEGFDTTYKKLEVSFDKNYYESDTYLLGKSTVEEGIKRGVFEKENDGSVWVDLTDVGMDRKIVLRSDGTAVYMTQDLGTAMLRYQDFGVEHMIYTVADEQDYHFKVLFEILKRLGEPYAQNLHHLSYGMVDLTTGKMKSREGTVVDADDLIAEVIDEAKSNSLEKGEIGELDLKEQNKIFEKIGFGALKFFILKVQPKKRMTFNPTDSLDMQGQTGPYIQNAYVRIQSLFRKNKALNSGNLSVNLLSLQTIHDSEKEIIKLCLAYPDILKEACTNYDPSTVANFCYALAKEYHRFYHDVRILGAENIAEKEFRLALSKITGEILEKAMDLLGIQMPSRM